MDQALVFNYRKSYSFLMFGILLMGAGLFLAMPFVVCRHCWNWNWFSHWWYLYTFPIVMALILLSFGLSQFLFWIYHINDKPYLTITDDEIKIDAETDIKRADIGGIKQINFLGCRILCLAIKNPQDYKFSWRFKVDRLFHRKYHAFICPDLIQDDQQADCLNWFKAHYIE